MDSGDDVLHTVPTYENYALPNAILHWDLAGCVLTVYLMRISSERGDSSTTTEEREIDRDVKEKLCFLAFDFDTLLKSIAESSNKKQTHVLSDGHTNSVGTECFRCECVFFQPSVIGTSASGIHVISFRAPSKMYFHVLLCLQFFQRMLSGFGSIRDGFQCGFGTPSEPLYLLFSFPCHCRTATTLPS